MAAEPLESIVENLVSSFGPDLRIATPLGLGKPNQLLNAVYERVAKDDSLRLTLFTALSLSRPSADSDLAQRFLGPFSKRQWGEDYEDLLYVKAARQNRLPKNIRIHEFYMQAGTGLRSLSMQCDYQASNYTHVVARLADEKPRIVLQLIARTPDGRYSLSCNPDLTLDLADHFRRVGLPLSIIGVVHPDLPFLRGDAEVSADFFHSIVAPSSPQPRLFALPRTPVDETDHAIGFHASRLVVDDGTLQIGIGSLSDALVSALICRHQRNPLYVRLLGPLANPQATQPFALGLHGLSEMVMDGFLHLRRAGILKRTVSDGSYLQGAFFLGSSELYRWLRTLQGEDLEGLRMGRISQVNQLYDIEPRSRRSDRKNARFFNTCMQVTLLGGAASETLEDGRVVSGVGGQYNFVAMAHELPDARSVLMLRSTRTYQGKRHSNLVWSHGQLTIPRHLRDVVVTEYGIADVRGRTDEETILAILAITDAEFQQPLLAQAKAYGKVAPHHELSAVARTNTPDKIATWIQQGRAEGTFATYPWGSDFTPEEERLAVALDHMKSNPSVLHWLWRSFRVNAARFEGELRRMDLHSPRGWGDRLTRRAVLGALAESRT